MIIDFHTHVFPDKIASKAIEKLSFNAGGLEYHYNGTVAGLKNSMIDSGTDVSVVLNISTNDHQQTSVNDFAGSINDKSSIFAFGSVHPDSKNALEELERIKAMGMLGVKFHPEYQQFSVDDEKMKPIYKKISSLGLITVFHAGEDYGFPPPYGATPEKMLRALSWFDSPVIAAHWGGLGCSEAVIKHLCGTDIYLDTSFSYGCIAKYYVQKIIELHGTEKLLFGTDSPWHTFKNEMRLLNSLGLSDTEKEQITSGNAKKLLGIK